MEKELIYIANSMEDNEDVTFIVMSLALEIEMGHWDRIHAMAHAIADVQDQQVFGPAGINAPRRGDSESEA